MAVDPLSEIVTAGLRVPAGASFWLAPAAVFWLVPARAGAAAKAAAVAAATAAASAGVRRRAAGSVGRRVRSVTGVLLLSGELCAAGRRTRRARRAGPPRGARPASVCSASVSLASV
jgi:hypothetical protein